MLEIKKCYVYKPLNLLYVYGFIEKSVHADIFVYRSGRRYGKALRNIWTTETDKSVPDGKVNWVYTKVIKNSGSIDKISVKVIDSKKKCIYEADIRAEILAYVPDTLTSDIGTKNNLTINTGKKAMDDFIKKQEANGCKPVLNHLTIESSSLCNLRCKYCIVSNNYDAVERCVISETVFNKAIETVNRLYEKGLRSIQLNALGEPLTNPGFVKMITAIYERTKIRNLLFFNNGMLFTKEISDAISEIPMNFKIFFSVDGVSAKENNAYRKGSDYEKVKENIYYFLRKIANKSNFSVRINNLQIKPDGDKVIIPEFLLNDFGFIKLDSHRAFYFPELSKKKLDKNKIAVYELPEKKICKRIFNESTIRANGDIIRCHWDSTCEIVMGNILKDRLEDIWGGNNMLHTGKGCCMTA